MILRTYRIGKELYDEFKIKCGRENITPSSMIRKMIKEYVKYKPKNNN